MKTGHIRRRLANVKGLTVFRITFLQNCNRLQTGFIFCVAKNDAVYRLALDFCKLFEDRLELLRCFVTSDRVHNLKLLIQNDHCGEGTHAHS